MKNIYAVLAILFLVSFSSVWGQSYTVGFPNVSNVNANQITFNTNITNTGSSTYFTKILIKARNAGAAVGEVNALAAHTIIVNNPDQEFSIDITGLDSETEYTAYCVSYFYNPVTFSNEYIEGALSNPATAVDFTTLGTPSPSYTDGYPSVTGIQESQITFNTNLNNIGSNTYYTKILVKLRGAGASIGEVSATATHTITVDNQSQEFSIDITGLSSGTEYTAYCVSYFYNPAIYDNEYIESGAPAAPATAVDFKTATPLSIVTYNPSQGAIDVPVNQNPQLTFNQDIEFVSPAPFTDAVYIMEQGSGREIQRYQFSPGTSNPNLVISGNTFTINLTQNMDASTATYITIPGSFIQTGSGELFGGINNAEANNWRFTTSGGPAWSDGYPYADQVAITYTNVDVYGQTDKDGTYIYVVTASDVFPTVDQIKNGTVSGALVTNQSSPGVMTANVDFIESIDISNTIQFAPNTTYYVYMVATDDVFMLDSEVGRTQFTTLEIDPPVATTSPTDGETDVSIYTSLVITYDEPVRRVDGTIIDNANVAQLVSKFMLNPANPVAFSATIDDSKRVITITPDVALNDNSGYDVSIFPVEDYLGNEQADFVEFSFTTANYVEWSGAMSSDWTVNQNWNGNFTNGSNVIIPLSATNMPLVNTSESVGNITIEAGAHLTIGSTGVLSVAGELELLSSNASSTGNATLLNQGALNVVGSNVRIMQQISNSSYPYYFSSPVVGATPLSIGSSSTFYYRDAQGGGSWGTISSSTTFDAAVGYVAYDAGGSSWEFNGDINNGDSYLFTAYRTITPNNFGWNLVGNPYPCAIDWDVIYSSLDAGEQSNFDNAFWLRINDTGQQGTYNGDVPTETNLTSPTPSHIPSMHGFYTKVTLGQALGQLTIPKEAREKSTHTYLKGARSESMPASVIKLAGKNGEWTDETVIAFKTLADETIEKYDSEKIFASSNDNLIELYTYHDNKDLTIDTYPDYEGGRAICLGYKCNVAGEYSILLKELKRFEEGVEVSIEDKLIGNMVPLVEGEEYSFSTVAGVVEDRFVLHVAQKTDTPTSVDDQEERDVLIYSNNRTVYIKVDTAPKQNYSLYDISGKIIKEGLLNSGSLNRIDVDYEGLVIVKVNSGINIYTSKLFLK